MKYIYAKLTHPLYFILHFLLVLVFTLFIQIEAYPDDLISLADRLLNNSRYDEAITEYKRFIFFHPYGDKADYAFFKMGLAYRGIKNWHQSLDAIETSIGMARNTDVADERRLFLATTMIASGNYSLAKLELINLANSTESEKVKLKAIYFSGVTSAYTFDWEATSMYFGDFYTRINVNDRKNEINTITHKSKRLYKSPRKAQILSAFVPGAGQLYAKNWRDGLNAFLLNGLMMGFTANAIYKGDYNNALLIFLLLTSRYYMGNIYHAGNDAEKYNDKIDRQTAENILKTVYSDEP